MLGELFKICQNRRVWEKEVDSIEYTYKQKEESSH